MIYNDIRKFGFIKFDHISKVNENSHLKNLGPEPLGNRFNFGYFKDYLKGRNRIIKDINGSKICIWFGQHLCSRSFIL